VRRITITYAGVAAVAAGVVVHAGLLSAQQPQTAQTAPPVFRAAAHLIVQPVTVKDRKGKPIEGLAAKDFIVTEDGKPQEVAFVEYQRIATAATPLDESAAVTRPTPLVAPELPSAPPPGDAKYRGRRLVVLYFDLYNMSFFDQIRMYEGANAYVTSKMTPDDMVAIMVFQNGVVRLKQNFTDDRGALREAIGALQSLAEDSNSGVGVTPDAGSAFGEDDDTFNLFSTDRQLAALQNAVTDLGPLPEIKTLVYLGSGLRLNGTDNLAQLRATVNAAVRASVTINPIDTRGLVAAPPLGDATRASPGGVGMFSGTLAQAGVTKQQQSQDTYYALAKDTGGRAMFDNNDLSLGIVQAAQAVTGYYMIGYYTKNTATDGKFRRVTVTLASSLDADLSYRAGYYAAKDYSRFNATDKERQLEDAMKLEDPMTDIPMALEVNYFQLNAAEYFVPVSVRMPGSELTRPQAAGSTHAEIDMIGEIKDNYGVTIRNVKDKLEFSLDAAAASQSARRPIQYETGFTVLPGQYVIKVLARDTTTGRIGTFQQNFVVPNLDRVHDSVAISSVVLGSQQVSRSDALYTVRQKIASDVANPLIAPGAGGLRLLPSVTRTFSVRKPLFVFLQAYERDALGKAPMRPLVAAVSLYRDGAVAFSTGPIGISEGRDPKSGAVPIRLEIPLREREPGTYVCQVTVLDPATGKASFWRTSVELVR
jgi:VWFA-related protein